MSMRTLFLVSSYAFNAPTLNDCSTTSLLETLPLLSKLFPWRTKKIGEQCCCQPDFLFKTMAEKFRPREGKRKRGIIIFLWHSPKAPGESHLPGLLCLTENSVAFQIYLLLLYSSPRWQWRQADKALTPVSNPHLAGPHSSNTFFLKCKTALDFKSLYQANASMQVQKEKFVVT